MFSKLALSTYEKKLKREIMNLIETLEDKSAFDEDYYTMTKTLNKLLEAYEKFVKLS